MQSYRLYRLTESNSVIDAMDFEGPDDQAAICEAVRIDHAKVTEIWCGPRFVSRVKPK